MLRGYLLIFTISILLIISLLFTGVKAVDKGGTLRCFENEFPDTYDPITSTNMPALRLSELIFESLLSETQWGGYEGQLAESYSCSADSLSVKFNLRQDVKWCEINQNESIEATIPFTAHDVLYTYQLLKNPKTYLGSTKGKRLKNAIKEVTVLDEYTIEFKLKKRMFNPEGLFTFKIVPKHKIKGGFIVRADPFTRLPAGTGYYCLFKDRDDVKIFKVNNFYYGEQANIEQIRMEYYLDESNLSQIAIFGGKQSICVVIEARIKDIPEYESSGDFEIRRYAPLNFHYLGYNLKNGLFSDKRVRKALTYAIDRKKIIESKYFGNGEVISGPYPPGSVLTDPDVKPFPYDTVMAKRLLREAGFQEVREGWMKAGKRLSFTLTVQAEKSAEAWSVAQQIQDYWKNIGVQVELESVTGPTWRQRVYKNREFEATLGRWRCDRASDIRPLFKSGSEQNYISYSDSRVDSLIALMDNIIIPEQRRVINWQLHEILAEECPYTFLWSVYRHAAVSKKINRSDEIHDFNFFGYINKWWIPESEQWRQ